MDSSSKKLRILIVDDHAMMRDSLRLILNDMADMAVAEEAGTGAQTLELCRKQSFDVILLDHRLPDMTGQEVARRIKELGTKTKIVAISMNDDERVRQEMLSAGADIFAAKTDALKMLPDLIRKSISD